MQGSFGSNRFSVWLFGNVFHYFLLWIIVWMKNSQSSVLYHLGLIVVRKVWSGSLGSPWVLLLNITISQSTSIWSFCHYMNWENGNNSIVMSSLQMEKRTLQNHKNDRHIPPTVSMSNYCYFTNYRISLLLFTYFADKAF